MEKVKFTPISDYTKPKKSPTNFVRETKFMKKETKSSTTSIPSKTSGDFIKKQDNSWDY